MDYLQLEQQLTRKMRSTRLICAGIGIPVLAASLAGAFLLDSRAEPAILPLYFVLIIVGTVLGTLACILAISHCTYCRYKTAYNGKQHITAYRGLFYNIVYVDGAEKGRALPLRACNFVEVWIQDRVKVTVHFTYSIFNLAHLHFSDDTASIEL